VAATGARHDHLTRKAGSPGLDDRRPHRKPGRSPSRRYCRTAARSWTSTRHRQRRERRRRMGLTASTAEATSVGVDVITSGTTSGTSARCTPSWSTKSASCGSHYGTEGVPDAVGASSTPPTHGGRGPQLPGSGRTCPDREPLYGIRSTDRAASEPSRLSGSSTSTAS